MTSPVTVSPVVAAVKDALTVALAASVPDVVVVEPFDLTASALAKSLTVAGVWNPDTGEMTSEGAVTVATEEVGYGRLLMETTTVACVVWVGSGVVDLPEHRAAANEVLTACRGALRDLAAVDGASARAQIVSQLWAQVVHEQGAGVVVTFEVSVAVLP